MSIKIIPNVLTLSRIVFVPFFVFFFYSNLFYYKLLSLILFFVCSLTDFLDGYLARKYNLVTSVGKFIDPLADKILVLSAFIVIHSVYPDCVPLWMILTVFLRDVAVTSLRLFLKLKKKTLKTSFFAKRKTLFQIVVIHIMLFIHVFNYSNDLFLYQYVLYILFFSCVLFTILSGLHYFFINLYR
tara:strand:- start:1047 stop:1601 length:555 start_codon:yes stop_codon:yes gene_type:complete